jgi:hypothetical protein
MLCIRAEGGQAWCSARQTVNPKACGAVGTACRLPPDQLRGGWRTLRLHIGLRRLAAMPPMRAQRPRAPTWSDSASAAPCNSARSLSTACQPSAWATRLPHTRCNAAHSATGTRSNLGFRRGQAPPPPCWVTSACGLSATQRAGQFTQPPADRPGLGCPPTRQRSQAATARAVVAMEPAVERVEPKPKDAALRLSGR